MCMRPVFERTELSVPRYPQLILASSRAELVVIDQESEVIVERRDVGVPLTPSCGSENQFHNSSGSCAVPEPKPKLATPPRV
jgi:hypothetical protein